jgi:hypothetical protein
MVSNSRPTVSSKALPSRTGRNNADAAASAAGRSPAVSGSDNRSGCDIVANLPTHSGVT